MKEKKTVKIEFRLTPEEKEKIRIWCAERHLTISEAIRWFIFKEVS